MKKLIAILLLLALLLCGCGDRKDSRFKLIDYGGWYKVYVDLETGVEYIRREAGGGIEPLLDSYGRPYIYPAFDSREDRLP